MQQGDEGQIWYKWMANSHPAEPLFTLCGCQAPNLAFGGGAYLATLPGGAVVESSIFSHNKVVGVNNLYGGGVGGSECHARIQNSSFAFNQLLSDLTTPGANSMVMMGGGIYLAGPVVNLTSLVLTGNVIGPKNTSCMLAELAYGAGEPSERCMDINISISSGAV
jgi:hypothetical protein